MKKANFALLAFLTLPMLFAPLINTASAVNEISFYFTAHVVKLIDPDDLLGGAISVNDTVTGVLTYDLDTPADIVTPYSAFYQHDIPPYGIVATVNGLIFQTNFTDVDFHVNVVNDHTGHPPPYPDGIVFHSYNNIFPIMLDDLYEPPPPPTLTDHHISWQIDNSSGTAISTLDLPTSFDLALWEQPFGLTFDATSYWSSPEYPAGLHYLIRSVVDAISEVPTSPIPTNIQDLESKIEELGSEGEIDNQGIVNGLIAKLNAAQKLVDKGKVDEAKMVLEDFITQVQNLSGIHITKEAADILILSATYIMSNL